ncbi:uncharacterized protein V1513DRAFT_397920 [Lipomyces chichibuensis]|uniref:uncharacterized protein n=1 Tax=Lipomyces chichibuensis TaxID=1546026 RepID=UPI0033441DA6
MAPLSPRETDPPPQDDPPPLSSSSDLFAPTLNPPMLAFHQSPPTEYDSAPLPPASSSSSLNASADVMSTAYTLFFPPDSLRRQLPMNLLSQPLQQPSTGASLPHVHFTQQSASIPYPQPGGSSATPIHRQELEQAQQHRPQLLSVPRHREYYYPPIRNLNEAADQDNTSTRFQRLLQLQAWSDSQSLSNPVPQTAAQSYYSAASLMPPEYGLPLVNQQSGIPRPEMLVSPAPTSSIPLPMAQTQTQTIPLYGPPHLPERQQPHLQQQPLDQRYAAGPHQDIFVPKAESRSKTKRFRLTHAQTRFLLTEFARQPHPDAALRERLAAEIPGLSPRQLQVWFQNRRAKLRKLPRNENTELLTQQSQSQMPQQNILSTQHLTREDQQSPQSSILQQPLQLITTSPQLQLIHPQREARKQEPAQGPTQGHSAHRSGIQ